MANHDDGEVAEAIGSFFPGVSMGNLARAIRRLRANGVWAETPTVEEKSFMRYQRIIADYGLIDAPYPFGDVVQFPSG